MKSKRLEDMSSKQKSKCVQWMLEGKLFEKSNSSPTWIVANSIQFGKEYRLSKLDAFSNLYSFKSINYKGKTLQAVPFNIEDGHKCTECFFLERKACPKDIVNNELYCTMCKEVDAALAPMIDCNFKEVNIRVRQECH